VSALPLPMNLDKMATATICALHELVFVSKMGILNLKKSPETSSKNI